MSDMIWRTRHERSERAAQVLMEKSPAVASLLLWAQHLDSPPDMGATGTDGKRIWYDENFAARNLGQQCFIVAHEVLHIALCHPTRARRVSRREGADFNHHLWNIACDALINEGLAIQSRWMETPPDGIRMAKVEEALKKNGFDGKLTTEKLDVETLYDLLKKHTPKMQMKIIGMDGNPSSGGDPKGGGKDDKKNKGSGGMPQPRAGDIIIPEGGNDAKEDQEMREWNRRFVRAQQGDKAAGILRGIQDLPVVRTPWQQILRTQIMAAVTNRVEDTWMRPSRRYTALHGTRGEIPYEPGNAAKPVPKFVVCIDTSGSIYGELFDRFVAELYAIMNKTSCHCIVIVCDAEVHGTFDLKQDKEKVKKVEFKGGGGTSFIPAIEAAVKLKPAIIVYLTDLMGSFPAKAPKCPVIWATPPEYENQKAPWGRVVCLKD